MDGLGGDDQDLHLFIAGSRAAFTTRLFADVVVQRATGQPAVGQVRFRWNLAEGHDFWLVQARGRRTDGTPSNSVSVKYTRLFTFARSGPS